jgi:peroxiredoxin
MGSMNVKKAGGASGQGPSRPAVVKRVAVISTIGIVVIGVAAAFVIWGLQRPAATQAVLPAAAELHSAESDLAKAADAVGFHPTTDKSVGIVETLPADTTLLPPSKSMLPVGQMAPDFSLATPQGETVKLSAYRGKTVLLEFFATWCPHCQAEAEHLRRLYETLPKDNFAFLSVNADGEDPGSLYAYDRFFSVDWPLLLDPATPAGSFQKAGGAGAVTRAYGVALYPTFYIIDPKGRVHWRNDREQPDLLLIEQLQNAANIGS